MTKNLDIKRNAKYLRKLNIRDDTILLIKSQTPLADEADALMRGLRKLGLKRVVVVLVEDVNSIKAVSMDDMNEAGWYHVET